MKKGRILQRMVLVLAVTLLLFPTTSLWAITIGDADITVSVTDNSDGTWTYFYDIFNTQPAVSTIEIVEFSVGPLFDLVLGPTFISLGTLAGTGDVSPDTTGSYTPAAFEVTWLFTGANAIGGGQSADTVFYVANVGPYFSDLTVRGATGTIGTLGNGGFADDIIAASGFLTANESPIENGPPVPEPTTLLLLGSGLLGIGAFRKRMRIGNG